MISPSNGFRVNLGSFTLLSVVRVGTSPSINLDNVKPSLNSSQPLISSDTSASCSRCYDPALFLVQVGVGESSAIRLCTFAIAFESSADMV